MNQAIRSRVAHSGLALALACVGCGSGTDAAPSSDATSIGGSAGSAGASTSSGGTPGSGGQTPGSGGAGSGGGGASAGTSGASGGSAGSAAGGPLKVFIDSDVVWDPSDVSALTFAHGLADACEIEIIGMTAVTTRASAARALDAINTYYGRPDIPIGVLKGATFLDGTDFTGPLSELPTTRYASNADAPDATQVFRQVLAQQPDDSVVVVSIGPLRNPSAFVNSTADAASPLSGKELIDQKVKFLSAMAGVFVNIGAFGAQLTSEWNVEQDPEAAHQVVENWPTPIMFSGFEIGWYTCPDYLAIQQDPAGPMGLVLGNGSIDGVPCKGIVNMDNAYGRPGWDQTSLLYAARGLGDFWTGEMRGRVTINTASKGENTWSETPDRQQGFLTNIGIDPDDGESANHAKRKDTLTREMAEIQAAAGKSGMCKARP